MESIVDNTVFTVGKRVEHKCSTYQWINNQIHIPEVIEMLSWWRESFHNIHNVSPFYLLYKYMTILFVNYISVKLEKLESPPCNGAASRGQRSWCQDSSESQRPENMKGGQALPWPHSSSILTTLVFPKHVPFIWVSKGPTTFITLWTFILKQPNLSRTFTG